jgi:hypothetical protein
VAELRKLQATVRAAHPKDERPVASRRIPVDLATAELKSMSFFRDEVEALELAVAAVKADLALEHLHKPDDEVWRFAIAASLDKTTDQVSRFIETHDRPILQDTCFFPVLHLKTTVERTFGLIVLVGTDDPRVPKLLIAAPLDPEARSFAMIPVEGTDFGAMSLRARSLGDHELRKLRAVVSGTTVSLHPGQIRFRLGRSYAFSHNLHGWKNGPETAYTLELADQTMERAAASPVATMREHPTNDIFRKADIALRWIERAQLATSEVVTLLFYFFALEALLGDTSEGLKAHGLAFRRAVLSHLSTGTFAHPDRTYFLYDEVRSKAVHGEAVVDVSERQLRSFAEDVRTALDEYLDLAQTRNFTKRGKLLRFIDEHTEADLLREWLNENGDEDWSQYFDHRPRQ